MYRSTSNMEYYLLLNIIGRYFLSNIINHLGFERKARRNYENIIT